MTTTKQSPAAEARSYQKPERERDPVCGMSVDPATPHIAPSMRATITSSAAPMPR